MKENNNLQATFDNLYWRDRMPKDSFWARLHRWAYKNLSDDDFTSLYSRRNRPSCSPMQMTLALLIQFDKGYSTGGFGGYYGKTHILWAFQ